MSTLFNAFEIPEQTIQSESGAAYTVPENYYARVAVSVDSGGTFLVNGKTVLKSQALELQNVNTTSTFVVPSGYFYESGNLSGGSGPGGSQNATVTSPLRGVLRGRMNTSQSERFTLKQGDAISGTGSCAYHLELYRIPGTA